MLSSAKAAVGRFQGEEGSIGAGMLRRVHVSLQLHLLVGPAAVSDTGLYYVLCDKPRLTADRVAFRGCRTLVKRRAERKPSWAPGF